MYACFTDRARKVMQLANQEAQRLNHEYIGTEHILLGLVKEGSGVAANVLENLDIDLRKIRVEIEKIIQSGPNIVPIMGMLPQTPRAKKVIEYSLEEARNLNHGFVGTEHLLLGLLREPEAVAAQVLMNLGLELEDMRQKILQVLEVREDVLKQLAQRTISREAGAKRKSRVERLARRMGLLVRGHRTLSIFIAGVLATIAGALISTVFQPVSDQAMIGALVGGVIYVVAVGVGCWAAWVRPSSIQPVTISKTGAKMYERFTDRARKVMPGGSPPANVSLGMDLNTAFMYLPEELLQALKEINDRIKKLVKEKEEAVAEQDFEKAVGWRDQADKIKCQLFDAVKKLQAFVRKSEGGSKS